MSSEDEVVDVDSLEKGLLEGNVLKEYSEADGETILYTASFDESEDNYVKYQTAQWVLYSLVLILAWGIGLLMLLYLPIRRYILWKDFRSRKLYVTPDAIVYKVTRPVAFPCFGVLKKEKHILLPSVADIVIEQGYLQSLFGIYSVRIENAGVRKPASDDVQIHGIAHPREFRKAVLRHLPNMKSSSKQALIKEDLPVLNSAISSIQTNCSSSLQHHTLLSPGEQILQKLEEVGSSVKRVKMLIEKQAQTSEPPA